MSRANDAGHALERGLSNRHIQMIGLGGAIGTGLFLGSAGVMKLAGPSLLLGYAIAGLIAFLIMRQLGEMLVDEPVSGSLSHFSSKYCGGFLGYLAGWNYMATYILVGMAELTAVGKYIQFWWPEIPTWACAAFFFVLINGLNLLNVRIFGEAEFWFATIKVVAVMMMIALGGWLLFGPETPEGAAVSNLWSHGGFLPNGMSGLVMAIPLIMFAFGGLEMIGFTAGEAKNPKKTIPSAINRVLYRIGIFYIAALAVLLALSPWDELVATLSAGGDPYSVSPFVKILDLLGIDAAAHILNLVVLTAALSVYNGVVYCNVRQLHAMAEQGHAPKKLLKLNGNSVPVNALLVTAIITAAAVLLNWVSPNGTLEMLMSLVVASTVMNWMLTSYTHLKFKRAKQAAGESTSYNSPLYPLTNYLCIAFILGLLAIMAFIPGMRISVWLIPLWLSVMYASYRKLQAMKPAELRFE
ncbi:amino acid permease [Metapseudomonas furukawaii]|uniref:amino acid permease n=1 Tax=Metapseudomonas furukawaii TaxID=1149133 RepID=UPI004045699D